VTAPAVELIKTPEPIWQDGKPANGACEVRIQLPNRAACGARWSNISQH
jgi:hypothetical protein